MKQEKFTGLFIQQTKYDTIYAKAKELFGELTSDKIIITNNEIIFIVSFGTSELDEECKLKLEEFENYVETLPYDENNSLIMGYLFHNLDEEKIKNNWKEAEVPLFFIQKEEQWVKFEKFGTKEVYESLDDSIVFKQFYKEFISKTDGLKNIGIKLDKTIDIEEPSKELHS
jgi:hypothetical protein